MRELDRCDFCSERADGVYEVLPPEVDAAERRLVLCADCRDTLSGVVRPLLDALDGRDADASAARDSAVTVEPTVPDASEDAPSADEADAAGADAGAETAADEAAGDAPPADEADTAAPNADDPSAGAPANGGGESADAASSASAAPNSARPDGYRRVVRLLRNRPAAMTRTDLAELAEGAYDLSAREVEAVVDAAIENGDLEETAEGLRAT